MRKLLFGLLAVLTLSSTLHAAENLENRRLVTIHGFSGSAWNMYYVSKPLHAEKMAVTHWAYPSLQKSIAEHAADLVLVLQQEALSRPGEPIYFLTHSMGGLVLRAALNHDDCPAEAQMGKAVLLAPPNQGSSWGRLLGTLGLTDTLGSAGAELMSEYDFEHLGQFPEAMEVMVIAGNFGFNPFIAGENDGTVAVEETYLQTVHQHVVIRQGHKSILLSSEAAALAKSFFLGTYAQDN